MSDANVNDEGAANALRNNGSTKLGFDIPLFVVSPLFRSFAEQGFERAKESCQIAKAASGEIAEVLREACSAKAKGADFSPRFIDFTSQNTNSALDT